jgi:hypothetical protein
LKTGIDFQIYQQLARSGFRLGGTKSCKALCVKVRSCSKAISKQERFAMLHRLTSAAIFFTFFNFIIGCAVPTKRFVSSQSVPRLTTEKITKVTLARGEVVKFDAVGARYYEKYKNRRRVIVGKTEEGKPVVIGLNQIVRACIAKDHVAVEDSAQAFSALLLVLVSGLLVAAFANGSPGS